MEENQLELFSEQAQMPLPDTELAPSNLPVFILHDINVFAANLNGVDALGLVLAGFDPDVEPDERILDERIYIFSAEDGLEVARRVKAIAATVKPLRKQISNLEDN